MKLERKEITQTVRRFALDPQIRRLPLESRRYSQASHPLAGPVGGEGGDSARREITCDTGLPPVGVGERRCICAPRCGCGTAASDTKSPTPSAPGTVDGRGLHGRLQPVGRREYAPAITCEVLTVSAAFESTSSILRAPTGMVTAVGCFAPGAA